MEHVSATVDHLHDSDAVGKSKTAAATGPDTHADGVRPTRKSLRSATGMLTCASLSGYRELERFPAMMGDGGMYSIRHCQRHHVKRRRTQWAATSSHSSRIQGRTRRAGGASPLSSGACACSTRSSRHAPSAKRLTHGSMPLLNRADIRRLRKWLIRDAHDGAAQAKAARRLRATQDVCIACSGGGRTRTQGLIKTISLITYLIEFKKERPYLVSVSLSTTKWSGGFAKWAAEHIAAGALERVTLLTTHEVTRSQTSKSSSKPRWSRG